MPNHGVINTVLKTLSLKPVNWLETYGLTNFAVIIAAVWSQMGMCIVIFLAGLQSISPAIYESCTIDGATAWETFWKITFPMISPMILVNAIYTVIDSFTASSNRVMSYVSAVYSGATEGSDVLATAMYWIYFAIVIVIIAAVAGIMSAYVFYQRRD